ncbi:MAG: hypothetical protein QXQ64_03505, partial [Candidatus Bathyarchaeia archaeon]
MGNKTMSNALQRLQKAVEVTIAAGYQLNKEAFDFLRMIATTEDPVELVSKALERINTLKDKPIFIGRKILEEFVEKPEPAKEEVLQPVLELIKPPLAESEQNKQIFGGKQTFRPYAKEVEADINIIDDPGSR